LSPGGGIGMLGGMKRLSSRWPLAPAFVLGFLLAIATLGHAVPAGTAPCGMTASGMAGAGTGPCCDACGGGVGDFDTEACRSMCIGGAAALVPERGPRKLAGPPARPALASAAWPGRRPSPDPDPPRSHRRV